MKVEVIIVGGGTGKRLNTGLVKALIPLKGRPLLTYCLKIFNENPAIDGIIVVGVKEFLTQFEKITKGFKKLRAVVPGGAMRSDSVKCGLKVLSPDTDLVLVHDAARPFIDHDLIGRLLAALKKNKAAIVGVPVKFTVKKVNRKTLEIEETPPRDLLWEAQTPQGFHRDVLIKAHAKKFKEETTDDAMTVERMGTKVRMVMGSYRNIKITTPEDILLAEQLF